jgi:hypothetical protein
LSFEEDSVQDFVRFPLAGGGSVVVEVEAEPGLERASAPSGVLRKATTTFEHALSEVRAAAGAALAQFRDLGPDEVELKFGVKLDAQAGAVIARTGLQGQFEVKLKWVRGEAPTEDSAEEEPGKPVAGSVTGPGSAAGSPAAGGADPVAGTAAVADAATAGPTAGGADPVSPNVP